MKNIRILIPDSIHKAIKIDSAELDKTMPEVINMILQKHYKEKSGKDEKDST